MAETETVVNVRSSDDRFEFRIPSDARELNQDEEWFSVKVNGVWNRYHIHDYDKIYQIPGLYEALVYDLLECSSPRRLVRLLHLVLENWSVDLTDLRVLDLGAGNGIVGEQLREIGVENLLGADILPEAARAARRDRPRVYDDYVVTDLTDPELDAMGRIRDLRPNCLVTVAALGFGDIPPEAFATAFNEIDTPGWVAFTIKEDFLETDDNSGFRRLIRRMFEEGVMNLEARMRIRHRLSMGGEPLFYAGVVGRKLADIPDSLRR